MSAGRKPRIAFLIHDLRDGGAERVTISLANGAAERGLDVDLVLINRTGKGSYFQSVDPRIRIASLPQGRTLTSAFGFRSYFDQARPDAAVSALTHVNIAAILGRMLSRCKPRLVVVEHNQMSKNIRHKRGFVRLAYAAVPRLYRRADIVGVVSEGVKQDFVEFTGFPGERVDVFYNPVVTPELHAQRQVAPDHPWFREGEPPVILGVGRLTEQKNFPMLIEAFMRLRAHRRIRLIILGQGPEQSALEQQAAASGYGEDVAFPGFVENPFAFMSRAAVFALSSDWEGLPTALIEAMACGTAVISTDCPSGPAEILEQGRLAPLTPPGDVAAFTEALVQALDRKWPTAQLATRARAFSRDAALDRYLEAAIPNAASRLRSPLPTSDAA